MCMRLAMCISVIGLGFGMYNFTGPSVFCAWSFGIA